MKGKTGWAALCAAWLAILAIAGCDMLGYVKPTENHRQLNALNEDAGDQLSKHPDPVVAQTGDDVKKNSEVLGTTLIGKPQAAVIYTPALAAKVRADTLKEFEANQPWYKKLAGYLLTGLGVLAVGGTLAARFFPATAPIMAIATPILGALTEIKQKADANPNDTIHIDEITPIISALTTLPKVGPLIADKLKDLHLDQIIHAPEAADVPTPAASPAAG